MNKAPIVPEQCRLCINFNSDEMICKNYDFLPGEGDRSDVKDCQSFIDKESRDNENLRVLADYIKEDKDGLVEQRIQEAVTNILDGYENKFKVMVIGIARRKISGMVKMVDIIDILLNKLSDINDETVQDMTPGQILRLLSELNASVNNDLAFIMKLIQPDSNLKDIQAYIDNRHININGASAATELKADEILKLTGTSRDKIREAFDAILHNVDVSDLQEVHEPSESELDDLEVI